MREMGPAGAMGRTGDGVGEQEGMGKEQIHL